MYDAVRQDPPFSWISEQCKVNQLTHQTLKCPDVQPQHSALSVQMLLNRHWTLGTSTFEDWRAARGVNYKKAKWDITSILMRPSTLADVWTLGQGPGSRVQGPELDVCWHWDCCGRVGPVPLDISSARQASTGQVSLARRWSPH